VIIRNLGVSISKIICIFIISYLFGVIYIWLISQFFYVSVFPLSLFGNKTLAECEFTYKKIAEGSWQTFRECKAIGTMITPEVEVNGKSEKLLYPIWSLYIQMPKTPFASLFDLDEEVLRQKICIESEEDIQLNLEMETSDTQINFYDIRDFGSISKNGKCLFISNKKLEPLVEKNLIENNGFTGSGFMVKIPVDLRNYADPTNKQSIKVDIVQSLIYGSSAAILIHIILFAFLIELFSKIGALLRFIDASIDNSVYEVENM